MATSIEVAGLSKSYVIGKRRQRSLRHAVRDALAGRWRRAAAPPFWALREVSFQMKQGDILGVVGANGSGKSTLLKILAGITEPTEGEARIRGRVGSLLEVGSGFHPELTGRENVFLSGSILGLSQREVRRQFDAIVAFAGVEPFLDTPVKRYASGMYLRLAFAVAAHLDTDVMLVDEVLAVGDAEFRSKCLARMGAISRDGRTVLFVSHDLTAVEELCTRALLLRGGRVEAEGSPAEIVAAHLSAAGSAAPEIDLRAAPSRSGERAALCSLALLDDEEAPRSVWTSGTPLRIRVGLELAGPVQEPSISVALCSEGRLVARAGSPHGLLGVELPPGGHTITGTLAALDLSPGTYTLDVELIDGRRRVVDRVGRAAELRVTPNEGDAAGRATGLRERSWIARSEWRVTPPPAGR
jgi:lipopolysaccharide transport system ATP-binding protein